MPLGKRMAAITRRMPLTASRESVEPGLTSSSATVSTPPAASEQRAEWRRDTGDIRDGEDDDRVERAEQRGERERHADIVAEAHHRECREANQCVRRRRRGG